ncbi:MAG: ABC transporter ATP-binding protein [Thermoanaerobaculia bacterium]|nr:ABC transporter ATP-binding protein [Thermoanaerobaculia bacterium]
MMRTNELLAQDEPLLEVRDLSYSYDTVEAVRGVTFAVERGELLGFLGPNGAGKTTTLGCIAGLLSDWKGSLHFDGRDFDPGSRTADRATLGLAPQELALYDDLTGLENLCFFGRLSGLAGSELDTAVEAALELSGLAARAGDRVGTYSGGMKRRLNLAIGDLHQPQLLLLDEPTAGVDPQSRSHIFECLRALRRSGRTLIYTTHYMEEAERLCDRVAIINEGAIVALGSCRELARSIGQVEADLEQVFLQLTGRRLRD